MTNQEHLAHLMNTLGVGNLLIPVEDIKTVDFSDAEKVTVETFEGRMITETDPQNVAWVKEQLDWK
jgi:hypothetical protein